VTEAALAGHAGFAGHWRAVAPEAGRARRWCERNRRALLAAARQRHRAAYPAPRLSRAAIPDELMNIK
jgi:hypothetical protein